MSLLVAGGRLVDPSQGLDGAFDLRIVDGLVAELAPRLPARAGEDVLDAAGLVVAPGFIDMHVHLREPGQEAKETVATGVAAAVAGGFTAVACMANTLPANDSRLVTGLIRAAAARAGLAQVHPIGAISRGLEGQELAPFGELVAAGCVAVSDDGRPVQSAELMRRALEHAQHFGLLVIQHAQDLDLSGDGVMHEGEWSTRSGLPAIPGAAEDVMVARDLVLLEDYGGRYHVAHVSTARSLAMVGAAKRRGLPVSCEVTPHHLVLADRQVVESGFDTRFKMNPPLRAAADVEALLAGIADGTVDAIASDHAPHHADEKCQPFEVAPLGVIGLETTVSICLDRLVRAGRIPLLRLVDLLSCGPARVLGVPGGSLAPGCPGDVTLLDLERRVRLESAGFRSRSRKSPFDGWSAVGAPAATVVAGRVVFRAPA